MDLIARIQFARDQARKEGFVATADALDKLLKNEALFVEDNQSAKVKVESTFQ